MFSAANYYLIYFLNFTSYCYHSVNVITFDMAQGDHIKRLLIYFQEVIMFL